MTSPKSIVCLILAALFAGFVGGCEQSPQKHPNVLILFTDDQRFDTVHALGNDEIQTPSLDKLVAEGVSFTQAHIMGGYNGAVCAPSRARLLTGRHAFGIVRSGSYFRPDDVLMPEWFAQHGYQTLRLANGTTVELPLPEPSALATTSFSAACTGRRMVGMPIRY